MNLPVAMQLLSLLFMLKFDTTIPTTSQRDSTQILFVTMSQPSPKMHVFIEFYNESTGHLVTTVLTLPKYSISLCWSCLSLLSSCLDSKDSLDLWPRMGLIISNCKHHDYIVYKMLSITFLLAQVTTPKIQSKSFFCSMVPCVNLYKINSTLPKLP